MKNYEILRNFIILTLLIISNIIQFLILRGSTKVVHKLTSIVIQRHALFKEKDSKEF